MWHLWRKKNSKGVDMARKKVKVEEVVEVVTPEVVEGGVVEETTVAEGVAVVSENFDVDPNDPRTRSDR